MLRTTLLSLIFLINSSPAFAKVEARFGLMLDLRLTELLDRPTKRVSVPVSMLVKPPAGIECSYYSSYMIKQSFIGGPAAQSTVLVPIENAAKTKCAEAQFVRQVVLPQGLGLFLGIKGDYAFFQGAEARNPNFIVLRLHDQAVVFVGRAAQDSANHGMLIHKIEIQSDNLILDYVQNAPVDCSAFADKKCDAKIAKQMKFKKEMVASRCRAGYQAHLQTLAQYWCRENNPKDPICLVDQAKKIQPDVNRSLAEVHQSVEARISANAKSLKIAKDWNSLHKASDKYVVHIDQDFECTPQP